MQPDSYSQTTATYDHVTVENPPLFLPIPDDQLLAVLNEAEIRAKQDYNSSGVEGRASGNIKFWGGDQVDQGRLNVQYQMAHVDNASFRQLENQIKLAVSKMPDIFATPPDDEEFNMEAARDIQQWLRERIDSNTIKRLLKDGLRMMNLGLTAVIKPRWNYINNDFTFELVDQSAMRFSQGSKIPQDGFTIDETDITFQYVEEPTTVVLAKFKKKSVQITQEIGRLSKGQMPARMQYTEVHFRWYDDRGRMSEGVAWRYGNVIMDAMREPYYDYDNPQNNYFDRPRKPYILFSYINLGKGIYEATTAFEQAKPLNRIINKRRRQITEISDRAVPKLAFAGDAINKETARNISPSPNEGIILNDNIDDIRKSMFLIPAAPPQPILFQDLADLHNQLDSNFATHSTTTGANGNTASGVSKQISREGDLVTSDDIADIVVERVVTEMTEWAMQFARLFYDDDRPALRIAQEEGDTSFVKLNRQKLETDIRIIVKGSTNDKQTRRSDALQMLTGKVTDPYTLFEDLDVPNPKERTRRLMSFIMAQQSGNWKQYLDIIGVDLETNKADEQDAQRDIEMIAQGGHPNPNTNPSESYVSTWLAYTSSPEYQQLSPDAKTRIQQHVAQMKQVVAQKLAAQNGGQPGQPGQPDVATQPGMPDPAQMLQQQQNGYQPEIDTSTAFTGNPGAASNAASRQASMQGRTFFPVSSAPLRN